MQRWRASSAWVALGCALGAIASLDAIAAVTGASSLAALPSLVPAVHAAVIPEFSFRPPFDSYDGEGNRMVPGFSVGGNANTLETFIRLTPDRQSKRGHVWGTTPLSLSEWTVTLRFRVSGQGKRLFGDGLAFWFTTHAAHQDGPIHGFSDKFTGFGILFDTFRNTEAGHVHKDVSLFHNNGRTKSGSFGSSSDPDAPGCDGDFRYHEGRDDFNINKKSAVKISFKDGRVSVDLDARNDGKWATCIESAPLPELAANWWTAGGYIGITASTGQLADNHDILSLLTSQDTGPQAEDDAAAALPPAVVTGNPQIDAAVKSTVTREVHAVATKLKNLHHHLEHQLSFVHDSLKHTLKKLQEQEEDNVRRITQLEQRLSQQLDTTVNDKVERDLQTRLAAVENQLRKSVDTKFNDEWAPSIHRTVDSKVASQGRSWLWPFIILSFIISGVVTFAYFKYRHFTKVHLL